MAAEIKCKQQQRRAAGEGGGGSEVSSEVVKPHQLRPVITALFRGAGMWTDEALLKQKMDAPPLSSLDNAGGGREAAKKVSRGRLI